MKTSFPLLLAAALLVAGPVSCLCAQTAPPVAMTFTVLPYGADGPAASYLTGGRYLPVRLVSATRSPAYNYVGPAAMEFYATSSVAAPGGTPTVVARATLPPNLKHALLVFVSGGDGYSVGVLPDDSQALPFGKACIYNASPFPVSVNYNFSNTVVLKPLESKVVDPAKGLVAVEVSVQTADGQWTKQVNNGWSLSPDVRREIFILNGEAFKGLDIAQRAVQMFSQEEKKPKGP
jgi:hypothetical protein